jgi:hypothetical protein
MNDIETHIAANEAAYRAKQEANLAALEASHGPAPFKIGQSVTARGFVNCFGKQVAPVPGLVVETARFMVCEHVPSYWRFKASEPRGFTYVEGAAHFFAAV